MRLPPLTYPLRVDTIGKLLLLGSGLSVYCNTRGCHHSAEINLVALAKRLGMDHSSMAKDLGPHFFCSRCREAGRPDRNVSFIQSTLTRQHSTIPADHPAARRD